MLLLLAISACAPRSELTVKLGGPQYFATEKGDCVAARYGQLSDDSLHFVKVTMPDGREYTLPAAISASGARYTDERELVWWEHQGTVRVDLRDTDGKWRTRYPELKPVAQCK